MSLKKQVQALPKMSPIATAIAFAIGAPMAQAETFTVTTTLGDTSAGSLLDAVAQAEATPDADIIEFDSSLVGTINLDTYGIDVTSAMTIDGTGTSGLSINFYTDNAGIDVSGTSLTLSNIVLSTTNSGTTDEDGDLVAGDLIDAINSTLTLQNANLNGNNSGTRAIDATNSDITVNSSIVSNFSTQSQYVYDIDAADNDTSTGGAISLAATASTNSITVSASQFYHNSSNGDRGGAIAVTNDNAVVDINISGASLFLSNSANYENGDGGAISIQSTGDSALAGVNSISITGTDAEDMVGFLYNSADIDGGVISVEQEGGALSISSTFANFAGNSSEYSAGGVLSANVEGADVSVSIASSTFDANTSEGNGGIAWLNVADGDLDLTVTSSNITNSSAGNSSGAISVMMDYGNVEADISGVILSYSSANGEAGALGIDVDYGDLDLNISASIFDNNDSAYGEGGAVALNIDNGDVDVDLRSVSFTNNDSGGYGGALSVTASETDNVTLSSLSDTFENNSAEGEGGAISVDVSNTYFYGTPTSGMVDLSISNGDFDSNSAGRAGGALVLETFRVADVSTNISATDFANNSTADGSEYGGGAIRQVSAYANDSLSIDDAVFYNNNAYGNGGAVSLYHSQTTSSVTISDTVFDDNYAYEYGGAFSWHHTGEYSQDVVESTLTVSNVAFTRNSSGDDAGALHLNSDLEMMATVSDSLFEQNASSDDGGAIGVYADTDYSVFELNIESTTITTNSADEDGGAIDVDTNASNGSTNINLTDVVIDNNASQTNGGGLLLNNEGAGELNVSIENASIVSNNAGNDGGGIALRGNDSMSVSHLLLTNTTLSQNTADEDAGAIFAYARAGSVNVTLVNTTVADNTGQTASVVFYGGDASNSSLTLANTVLAGGQSEAGSLGDLFVDDGFNIALSLQNTLIENPVPSTRLIGTLSSADSSVVTGVDPMLEAAALNDNGSFTMLPMSGSPLIDAGSDTIASNWGLDGDQRGGERVVGSAVDIGALEVGGLDVVEEEPTTTTASSTEEKSGGIFGGIGASYLIALLGLVGLRRKIK